MEVVGGGWEYTERVLPNQEFFLQICKIFICKSLDLVVITIRLAPPPHTHPPHPVLSIIWLVSIPIRRDSFVKIPTVFEILFCRYCSCEPYIQSVNSYLQPQEWGDGEGR